jgi:hypothetical protein
LIAVYGASGLAAVWLASRFLLPVSKRAAAVLLLLPLILTGRAVFTGGFYGPLNISYSTAPLSARAGELPERRYENGGLSDVAIQSVPWREAVREAVFGGHLPLLNRFTLSGDILLAAYQPGVFHPATWIGFLLPLPTAWTFAMAFTQFLAGLFAFLFLRELEAGETAAFFTAAAWTLSNLVTTSQGWSLAGVFVAFPLLLFGLSRLARAAPGGFGSMVAASVFMWVAGHAETVLYANAAAGVFFLFELGARPRKALLRAGDSLAASGMLEKPLVRRSSATPPRGFSALPLSRRPRRARDRPFSDGLLARSRRPARAAAGAVAAGVLAFAISAVAVLPFLEALPQTIESGYRRAVYAHAKKSVSVPESLRGAIGMIAPYAYYSVPLGEQPRMPQSFLLVSRGYVGGLALIIAAVGLTSARRAKWGLLTVGLSSLLVAVGFPGITDAVTSLPLFDIGINDYFAGISAFCLAALAGLGVQALTERGGVVGFALPALVLASLLAVGLSWRRALLRMGHDTEAFETSLLLLGAPILLFVLTLALWPRLRPCLGAFAVALLLLSRTVEIRRDYTTFPSRLFYPKIPELSSLPVSQEPYRTAGLGYSLVPNQSSLYGLEDPRGYEAMTLGRHFATFPLWSVLQPVWFNRIDDPSRPFLSFLNVRFLLAEPTDRTPPGWIDFARGRNCALFENPAVLPRAFAPERIRFVRHGDGTVEEMKTCSDFGKLAWIEDASETPREIQNGRAAVTARRDGADLDLTIHAEAPSWIVVSQTAWKGWKAFAGERLLPLKFANHAFLGFRVSPGTHRVRLVYRPNSFRIGVAVSLLSLGGAVAVLVRRKRPLLPLDRVSQEPSYD